MNQEKITERLSRIRNCMEREGLDAYLVPTEDFHASEYVGDYFKAREYITGFTGSAGTALIMRDMAGLWTDGRYFLQAEQQLAGTGIKLFRSGDTGVPTLEDYLAGKLKEGAAMGFDGRTLSEEKVAELEKKLEKKKVRLAADLDLVGEIWTDRPALSAEPVYELGLEWTGCERKEKLRQIRERMKKKGASVLVLTSLDDIAWLLNLRGGDVHCCPVFLSYLVMKQDQALLFANEAVFPEEIRTALAEDGIELRPYDSVYSYTESIPSGEVVWLSKPRVNSRLVRSLSREIRILDEANPTELIKAMKNETEIRNMRLAHIRDGVAVTRFIYWLKKHAACEEITELSAAGKLQQFREEQEHFLGNSFDPIIAYGPHGSKPHYAPSPESDVRIEPRSLLVADTGGHYYEGTTDITRTIVMGELTEEEKRLFTAVLRGHLNLGAAVFRKGCSGVSLDILARQPLWDLGLDYNHGTGHGVGFLLNVHEGPQRIIFRNTGKQPSAVFRAGMITSDEPGYYKDGEFGIRHENLILCRQTETSPEGEFLCFEYLTMAPFDLEGILPEEMTDREKELLNAYHRTVFEKLSPHLPEEEKEWLKEATRPVR